MTSQTSADEWVAGIDPVIDRSRTIDFTFDGQPYIGFAGDTIASALYRAGVRTFSRSFKYHRPRGLMCLSGACPNCLVNVNGTPNARACMTQVQAGMQVRSQNAWPSLEHDLLAVTDRFDRLLPVGFYYKMFIRPRRLWPAYETVLRHAAGLGTIDPDPDRVQMRHYDKQYRYAEVTVVGGGPAGLSAALAAADLGAQVILIDENSMLGGHLRSVYCVLRSAYSNTQYALRNTQYALGLADAVHDHPNIEVLTEATAFGWYEGNLLGVVQGDRLIKLRTQQLVVATGRIEQPLVFHNNDLPGVFLGSGLQRLMNLYDVWPGRRALVVTFNDYGWTVARNLLDRRVDVALVVDARPQIRETDAVTQVRAAGVATLPAYTIQAAQGREGVTGAVVVRLGPNGHPISGTEIELKCDLISVSAGFTANNALLYQSGCRLQYDPALDDFVPTEFVPGVHAAGHAAATDGLEAILLEGQVAGRQAALNLGHIDDEAAHEELKRWQQQLNALKVQHRSGLSTRVLESVPAPGRKKFVCFCEDVTEKDLKDAIAEGFNDIETLKRYSTISMGPCQGKMCSLNAIRLCARETDRTIADTGTTTARPPFTPVKLGVLAGQKLEPVRLTPLHHQHLDLGATMMNAGQWKRPEHYGNPNAEVRAVRERVGLIDVSTLGKIDVQGPDAVQLLEWIYTGRFHDLPVGRIRYGVMCTDEGIVFDDGVVCRLADEHYYLTTSTGGIEAVYQWLTWWLAGWDLRVHVTNVTSSYAAVNVAGPRARDVVSQLTDLDLSNQAFPYMHVREATVAGVPARLLRIGFVGELGYEIHYPAEYGVHVWKALMEAGADFGIRPFGVEAQRILRLEKAHVIIGQDTDALSDPFAAGMGWTVQLDKADFVGKPSLLRVKEQGTREQLIGFEMLNTSMVPEEGAQVVENEHIIGRVTSARYSPTLGKAIGLGWVHRDKAQAGTFIQIRTHGTLAQAMVVRGPFYDPSGERLRK